MSYVKVVKKEELPDGGEKLYFSDGSTTIHTKEFLAHVERERKNSSVKFRGTYTKIRMRSGKFDY